MPINHSQPIPIDFMGIIDKSRDYMAFDCYARIREKMGKYKGGLQNRHIYIAIQPSADLREKGP
jgi:hypothetical protein